MLTVVGDGMDLAGLRMRDAARAAYDIALKSFMACDADTSHAVFFARAAQMNAARAWDSAAELLGAPDLSVRRREAYESLFLAEVREAANAAATAEVLASSTNPDIDTIERLASKASDACINIRLAPSMMFIKKS